MRSVDRDAFSKAKDDFIMSVVRSGAAGEAATKVAVTLAVMFANRAAFEGRGELTAWPSMRLLAEETGLFRSRIARALSALESAGHLLVDRPEKRGATHHNRYTLVTAIGRTNVANSIGRTDADNDTPQLAAPVRTILAAPVGPNSLEEPLEGGRALGRASAAPMQDAVSIICDGRINDADGGDLGGLEAPPAAPAVVALLILGDIEPPATRPFAPVTEADLLVGGVEPVGIEPAPSPPATLADLDRLQAEEAAALAYAAEVAEDDLSTLWGDADLHIASHLADAVDGISGRCGSSRIRFERDLNRLLNAAHPTRRIALRGEHLNVVCNYMISTAWSAARAAELVEAYNEETSWMLRGAAHG